MGFVIQSTLNQYCNSAGYQINSIYFLAEFYSFANLKNIFNNLNKIFVRFALKKI